MRISMTFMTLWVVLLSTGCEVKKIAVNKILPKSVDETIQGDSATASIRLKHGIDVPHRAALEEKPRSIGLCAVVAPDSDAYSVNCRLKGQEVPRELMPSSPAARQLTLFRSEAARLARAERRQQHGNSEDIP